MLDMDESTPLARGLYLATVGQVVFRASWANSLLAHEYAHFANSHRFGLINHDFRDGVSGEIFGWGEAWRRTFIKFEVGAPATSSPIDGSFDSDLFAEKGIETALAWLNWQMQYSGKRVRGWLAG